MKRQVPYAPKGTPVPIRVNSRMPGNTKIQVARFLMYNIIVFEFKLCVCSCVIEVI